MRIVVAFFGFLILTFPAFFLMQAIMPGDSDTSALISAILLLIAICATGFYYCGTHKKSSS